MSPFARTTDPETSHEAAASVTNLRESQQAVLNLFRQVGPMTDARLVWLLGDHMSPSGVRTRRAELVQQGLVRDTGRRDVTRSNRRTIVWEAVNG